MEEKDYCICNGKFSGAYLSFYYFLFPLFSFMIQCDRCNKWYHGPCVGLNKEQADKIEYWICQFCLDRKEQLARGTYCYLFDLRSRAESFF